LNAYEVDSPFSVKRPAGDRDPEAPRNDHPQPPSVAFFSEATIPTATGELRVRVYRAADGEESIALLCGTVAGRENIPVRVHSACLTSETFGSLRCDCRQQLDMALEYIQRHGGVVIYLHQEGRGIGLGNKIKAYALQQQGHDTVSANQALDLPVDGRSYEAAHAILADLGVRSVSLMTNNPAKTAALRRLGIVIAGTIPVVAAQNVHSFDYLETKRVRMGHAIELRIPEARNALPATRPYVHLNFAMRACDAGEPQSSRNISCALDWHRVHLLRERYTAIAVGANTWLADRPRLTARAEHLQRPPRRQPHPVVFLGAKALAPHPDSRRVFVVGTNLPRHEGIVGIEAQGYALAAPLAILRRMAIDSMLVEGGATLLRSFIAQEAADEITIYVSTPSAQLATDCALREFPALPLPMRAERCGDGTVLHWSRAA
jgi:GTP cyclohydrolase II/3,4-dihydroxy 2-butanone 4-phosphate synthase/GTP cyclohydrolase II